jgi:predicted solute-binding protein
MEFLAASHTKTINCTAEEGSWVTKLQIGVPDYISVRPLVFGLTRRTEPDLSLVYKEPGHLSVAIERGELEAALIPAIEYLRGAGGHFVDGPALIAKPATGSIVLLAQKPIQALEKIAVDKFCRSPLAVLRITLGEVHGILPDLCVTKATAGTWREDYDAVLLSGDAALETLVSRPDDEVTAYNITDMWYSLTALPLVLGLWAFNDKNLAGQLAKMLITSRNFGIQNLSHLADGISHTTQYDGEILYDYYTGCWDYHLSAKAKEGLMALEEYALRYDLIQHSRTEGVTIA